MKSILFISTQSPFETYSGARQRSYLLFKTLCEIGKVDLVCFTQDHLSEEDKFNDKYTIKFFGPDNTLIQKKSSNFQKLFSFFNTDCIAPKNEFCSNIVNNIIKENKYDYIVIRYIQNALKCEITKGHNVIIDADDLPEQQFLAIAKSSSYSIPKRLFNFCKSKASRKYTNKILKNIYHSFLPNKRQIKFQNSSYLPNIPFPFNQTVNEVKADADFDNSIMFIGLMSWAPNYNGVEHFLKKIYPLILKSKPNIKFNIIGKGLPEDKVKLWSTIKGVNIKGFVKNIDDEYSKSKVVIVPIYEGAGSNIKVLEAMNKGKTTILSVHATRGFEDVLVDGKNTLIAKDDREFAEKVILGLTNKDLNNTIAKEAKQTISTQFSYETFSQYIHKIIK
jgi:glycosyltransferase involved in cell wall biosynthesis